MPFSYALSYSGYTPSDKQTETAGCGRVIVGPKSARSTRTYERGSVAKVFTSSVSVMNFGCRLERNVFTVGTSPLAYFTRWIFSEKSVTNRKINLQSIPLALAHLFQRLPFVMIAVAVPDDLCALSFQLGEIRIAHGYAAFQRDSLHAGCNSNVSPLITAEVPGQNS